MILQNKQWIYVKRPENKVGQDNYKLNTEQLDTDTLKEGEILIQSLYISVDPYMRIGQSVNDTWDVPHPINTVQGAGVVGKVIHSKSNKFKEGDIVNCYTGWQEYAIINASLARKVDTTLAPISTAIGILGMPAQISYFGLLEAGKLKEGETVVVSGAAGAVGSTVVQIAKIKGCKVIGIVGSDEKVNFLVNELGIDAGINYNQYNTQEAIEKALNKVAPEGVDLYFDNVGGYITDAVINCINLRARLIICGQISQYNDGLDIPQLGPRFLHKIFYKRATIQGVLSRDYNHRIDEMLKEMGPWVRDGKIKYKETFVHGFDQLPNALASLFKGANTGKLVVSVNY